MIRIAGYGRMSTDKQQLSPEVQERMIRDWYEYQVKQGKWDKPTEFVGMFVDRAVSSKVDLLKRPVGQHLLTLLGPGDLIVVAKYNRAFRSAADAERTLDILDEAGIKMAFLDLNIDTSTANGKMLAGILAVVSKHERDLRSETTKDALNSLQKSLRPIGKPPIGWRTRKQSGKKVLCPDNRVRVLANAARELIRQGAGRRKAYRQLSPYYQKHHLPVPANPVVMLAHAAAACLEFPRTSRTEIRRALGYRHENESFVRRDDHQQIIEHLNERLREFGYDL